MRMNHTQRRYRLHAGHRIVERHADKAPVGLGANMQHRVRKLGDFHIASLPLGDFVIHLRYSTFMKTATIPAIRVQPALREQVESSLLEGETLSEFVEQSVRTALQRRRDQSEFIARGMASLNAARQTKDYVDSAIVIDGLQRKLDAAKANLAKRRK